LAFESSKAWCRTRVFSILSSLVRVQDQLRMSWCCCCLICESLLPHGLEVFYSYISKLFWIK
jgi:hypothetical protein